MDICLIGSKTGAKLRPASVHGMLWLQTHFDSSTWEAIALKQVFLSKEDAVLLSNDAEEAGLRINLVPDLSTSHIF